MRSVWLIGMMGSGKSAVASGIAVALGLIAVDTDEQVAQRMGCSIAELWGSVGEAAFRDMEAARIEDLADKQGLVIATGGGAVLRPANVAAMKRSGLVVWLEAPAEVLATRVGGAGGRPLLEGESTPDRFDEILAEREHAYRSAADVRIDTTIGSVEAVVDAVAKTWNRS